MPANIEEIQKITRKRSKLKIPLSKEITLISIRNNSTNSYISNKSSMSNNSSYFKIKKQRT